MNVRLLLAFGHEVIIRCIFLYVPDDIYKRRLETIGQVTAMYPSIDSVKYGLFNYHVRENIDKCNALIDEIHKLIERYSLREDS